MKIGFFDLVTVRICLPCYFGIFLPCRKHIFNYFYTKFIFMKEERDAFEMLQNLVQEMWKESENFTMVFSKPRHKSTDIISMQARPVLIKNNLQVQCVTRKKTKDETKNQSYASFQTMLNGLLEEVFFNLDIFVPTHTYQYLQNQKGKKTLLKKKAQNSLPEYLGHNHQKKSYINPEGFYYKELGLISGQGQVFSKGQKKYNQVNRYIETLSHLLEHEKPEINFSITDMGSGKAYLTFALYDYLTNVKGWKVKMTGYENRSDLVQTCNELAKKMSWSQLHFEACSIDQAPVKPVDMIIALHACDIATDMAISYGIKSQAKYIVLAPCCQKQIRKSMSGKNVLSPILKYGILEERQAEILTDGMRALLLQHAGYQTQVFEFISLEHTAKNVMIVAKKGKKNPDAWHAYQKIKESFGIPFHYLEKLLDITS